MQQNLHINENFYAFYYEDKNNYGEHFDEFGKTLRKAFLKAPLNFIELALDTVKTENIQ